MVLSTAISLIGLWALYFRGYRAYRVDLFRDNLFRLRDELFDFAAAGEIAFDHEAYGLLRTMINGVIRGADRVGFLTVLIFAITSQRELHAEIVPDIERRWQKALGEVNATTERKLKAIRLRMHLFCFDQMLFASPSLALTLVPLLLWVILTRMGSTLRERLVTRLGRVSSISDRLDSAAFAAGGTD
jgi:hypothetical protein